jgi:hypothetical protein
MSKIIRTVLVPLSLPVSLIFGEKAADAFAGAVLTVAGVLTGQPELIGLGLSYGAKALAPTPKMPSQTERLNASINPREAFKRVLGRTAMATDVRYCEWFGTNQERFGEIIAVASHKVKSVQEVWLNDELAWSSTGGVTSKYNGYFWVRNVVLEGGAANGVTFGSGQWNNTRRLTGCAFVFLEFKVTGNSKKAESPFSSGVPSRMTIIGEGGMVYDPRRDSTVLGGSGTMRADDQSTWAFDVGGDVIGGNLPLQILAELLGWKINGKLALGSGLPKKRIDLPSFITAANIADELVNRSAGGTEPRYRGAGVLSESDDPQTRLNTMLAACNGRLRDTGGRLSLVLMHNDLASAATDEGLTDDDVIGAFTWNPDPSVDKSSNVIRGKYTDPSSNSLYQQVDYPDVAIDSPDGIERAQEFDLVWVESPSQAQRIVKQNLQRRQYDRTFQAPFDVTAWRYNVGDIVPLTFSPLNFNRWLGRVQQIDQRTNPPTVILSAESSDIYAWDADDRAPVVPASPIVYNTLNNPLIQAIADAVQASTIIRGAYIKVPPPLLTAADVSGAGVITVADHVWDYPNTTEDVARTGGTVTGLDLGTRYYVYFDDSTLEDTAPTYHASTIVTDALNSTANPYRHYLDEIDVPGAGDPPSSGSGSGGGGYGGGGCPCGTMYLRERDRGVVPASTIAIDDWVWGKHEITGVWGWYRVSNVQELADQPAVSYQLADATYETSISHLNWANNGWRKSASLPSATSIGNRTVYAITVEDAHTYELLASAAAEHGALSHNKLMDPAL